MSDFPAEVISADTTSIALTAPDVSDVSLFIQQLKGMNEVDRVQNAEALHVSVIDTCVDLAERWYKLSNLLIPIHELNLWKHLYYVNGDGTKEYFTSFKEYVTVVVQKPITTVGNSLYVHKALLDAGRDPKDLADISQSRVKSLASVLKAFDGAPPEDVWNELVDKARSAKTRQETREFNDLVSDACAQRGVETKEWLRLEGDATSIDFIKTCIDIQKESKFYEGKPPSDCTALEHICVQWMQNTDPRMITESAEATHEDE